MTVPKKTSVIVRAAMATTTANQLPSGPEEGAGNATRVSRNADLSSEGREWEGHNEVTQF